MEKMGGGGLIFHYTTRIVNHHIALGTEIFFSDRKVRKKEKQTTLTFKCEDRKNVLLLQNA